MTRALFTLVLCATVCWLGTGVACAATALGFARVRHADARDVAGGPLDVVSASFGQQETRLLLRVRTAGAWSSGALATRAHRSICLLIAMGPPDGAQVRLCLAGRGENLGLRAERLVDGAWLPDGHRLHAMLARPDARTVTASFTPLAAGLPLGSFAWTVQTQWRDRDRCSVLAGCSDQAPDRAPGDEIGLLAQPACFGAAALAPGRPCVNPALRAAVVPSISDALITPNASCRPAGRIGLVKPCTFGADPDQAQQAVALIGDSHAAHWRGAFEVVAQARRWVGVSITRAGCPLSRARPRLASAGLTRRCDRPLRGLHRHPRMSRMPAGARGAARRAEAEQAQGGGGERAVPGHPWRRPGRGRRRIRR